MIAAAPAVLPPVCEHAGRAGGRPLRVLHVVGSLQRGGMETALLRQLRCWTQTAPGDEHGLVVLGGADAAWFEQCPAAASWLLQIRGRSWSAARHLRRIIRTFAPDVVHARTTAVWLDAARAARHCGHVPLMLSFHGREHLREPGPVRRLLLGWAARRAHTVITLSYDSADWVRRTFHVPSGRLTVIPNGVDADAFRADPPGPRGDPRPQILSPRERFLVLCVANLVPVKGLDVLLDAWRRVRMIVPDARLAIAGEGPARAALTAACATLRIDSSVTLLGRRSDVPALMSAADLFVLPSHYECCSNALLEAMASGLPCIATTGGGNPELIEPNRTGWLVPPGDGHALAETILSALLNADARRRVGEAARRYVAQEHAIARILQRYRDCCLRAAASESAEALPAQETAPCAG